MFAHSVTVTPMNLQSLKTPPPFEDCGSNCEEHSQHKGGRSETIDVHTHIHTNLELLKELHIFLMILKMYTKHPSVQMSKHLFTDFSDIDI